MNNSDLPRRIDERRTGRSLAKLVGCAVPLLLLGGCVSVDTERAVAEANRALPGFTANELRLGRGAAALRERRESVRALLAAPLTLDDAVRAALLGSPSLQALLAAQSADIADAAAEGRLANPVLSYERLRHDGETEIARVLSMGLLELLTLPQRQRIAAAAVDAAELRLAVAVVDEVTRVRQAWVRAVAAEQRRRYAERVLESARASAELARRMETAGNFNRLARARQQAFEADARTQSVLAKQQAVATREELSRALGLDDEMAALLQLPERLPDLPREPLSAAVVSGRATNERLDVRLAQAQWRTAAVRQGLGAITSVTDIELSLVRETSARGYEVDIRLPLFDTGELKRTALDARTLAALSVLEATLRSAGSHLRESYAGYVAAHEIALHHRDELVPLRKAISEENLLRYNGMIIGVFELLADAREQIAVVMSAIDAEQQFWLADAALQSSLAGRPVGVKLEVSADKAAGSAADH